MELSNCYRCGKLFAKAYRNICQDCARDIEAEYTRCADYLRENRQATMIELSDETGVGTRQITQFIREGRISVANMPNLAYPCEVCGEFIRDGHMCENCRRRLMSDLERVKQDNSNANAASDKHNTGTYRISEK
ncbi:flagellar protein [Paenibacillus sp. ACRRX]|uniref:TIGR03826 family flagellar region protein n=1 Tax=unclassified Paenibacillus TaxID=185978 RepID=UPI001EF61C75|nr:MULTISPECIES: TIGR03826 family flagellar region protein [unclassified Paenibacillus]MCG7407993.1 flagellar protein [Paenibacillus sp. ACRRX]MDK8181626.1 flagellar protein [Paenibacillus sp. UMB4589-SE434]